MAKSLPLGATPTGKDWCLKALHPADPLQEVQGIPDHSAIPSVFMNYQSSVTLSPSVGASGTWAADIALLPDPLAPLWLSRQDSIGITRTNHLNPQVPGTTYTDKLNSFLSYAQRWRLAYLAVTVYQDGPDLANQGVITVCQNAVEASRYGWCRTNTTTGETRPMATVAQYQTSDIPNFDYCQAMPNAYYSRSRDGAYVPLKLTETCQDWRSAADNQFLAYEIPDVTGTGVLIPIGVRTCTFPLIVTAAGETAPPAWNHIGAMTLQPCNGTWASICARNMATTTSLSFFVRAGYELQVQPASTFSPHQKLSPPYDSAALDAYFAIAREMKDAYPADYNDLGKIWDVISSIGTTLAPALTAIHPALGTGVAGAISAGNAIRSYFRQSKSAASMAQMESAKEALKELTGPEVKAELQRRTDAYVPVMTARLAKRKRKKPGKKKKAGKTAVVVVAKRK